MNDLSPLISKEWIGLILLPTVSVMAGECKACSVACPISDACSCRVCHGRERRRAGPVNLEYQCGRWVDDRTYSFRLLRVCGMCTLTMACQQTALFVIPSMVILGWILDKPLALLFDPFESVVCTPNRTQLPTSLTTRCFR